MTPEQRARLEDEVARSGCVLDDHDVRAIRAALARIDALEAAIRAHREAAEDVGLGGRLDEALWALVPKCDACGGTGTAGERKSDGAPLVYTECQR